MKVKNYSYTETDSCGNYNQKNIERIRTHLDAGVISKAYAAIRTMRMPSVSGKLLLTLEIELFEGCTQWLAIEHSVSKTTYYLNGAEVDSCLNDIVEALDSVPQPKREDGPTSANVTLFVPVVHEKKIRVIETTFTVVFKEGLTMGPLHPDSIAEDVRSIYNGISLVGMPCVDIGRFDTAELRVFDTNKRLIRSLPLHDTDVIREENEVFQRGLHRMLEEKKKLEGKS